jgi:hypothetical protein
LRESSGVTGNTTHHNISQGDGYSDITTVSMELSWWATTSYQRAADICITPGEMLLGGEAMRLPVLGLTIGMALVPERIADGWWTLRVWLLVVLGGEM